MQSCQELSRKRSDVPVLTHSQLKLDHGSAKSASFVHLSDGLAVDNKHWLTAFISKDGIQQIMQDQFSVRRAASLSSML